MRMRGIVWDDYDVDADDLRSDTERIYDRLKKEFLKQDVDLEVFEDWEEFCSEIIRRGVDFAMIDLLKGREKVGINYARTVRDLIAEGSEGPDPEFPIFIISRNIEQSDVLGLDNNRLVPVSKHSPSALIVSTVRRHMYRRGRWVRPKSVFVIARQSPAKLDGSPSPANTDLILLEDKIRELGYQPNTIRIADGVRHDLLTLVNDGILSAGRIIVLITPDEQALTRQGDPRFMARPNIYVELGMVAAQASTLRKTTIVMNRSVEFPSDYGGRVLLKFSSSIKEVFPDLDRVFQR